MNTSAWKRRLHEWRGGPVESNLSLYEATLHDIKVQRHKLTTASAQTLQSRANEVRMQAQSGTEISNLLVETFAIAALATQRTLGLRPFDVQIMAGVALHLGKLVEMQTGEGKTLVAVMPAVLNALTGQGVHILTFNDYLARRDANWMGPIYRYLGLTVAFIQEEMSIEARRDAYNADITYATAREAGFDFLRMNLARKRENLVHRGFNYAIIDEADSILIDESRSPLVIAGDRPVSEAGPYRIAELIRQLNSGTHWETDENARNVFLTEAGIDSLEQSLVCRNLHSPENLLLLTEVNQALHARALLHRDVDYIVRDSVIELVDEFTGRVVEDRRWPDGLQAAVEAKEGVPIRPGGRVLGSITLQHFLQHYSKLSGMTATAQTAAEEFKDFYNLNVVPIPPNTPCIREDKRDVLFTHKQSRDAAVVREIARVHETGRPILVGTSSVHDSESFAARLSSAGIECRVLNAKNDEAEAEIIAEAGTLGAVTISTNMAGRGTDIKLGGVNEADRDRIVALGGLYVIGTNRHESRRIDNQLRGRSGRQGDPGTSCFFVSLEDDLMVRFGIEKLIPATARPANQEEPIDHPVVRREVERLQRIVEGQNFEIRKTLAKYSAPIEEQRRRIHEWRMGILTGEGPVEILQNGSPEIYQSLRDRFGTEAIERLERSITLHHIDECWAEHLSFLTQLREGIHLEEFRRGNPLLVFHMKAAEGFWKLDESIRSKVVKRFAVIAASPAGIVGAESGLEGPASTWTYLINDKALSQMQQLLFGMTGSTVGMAGLIVNWPLVLAWAIWRKFSRQK